MLLPARSGTCTMLAAEGVRWSHADVSVRQGGISRS